MDTTAKRSRAGCALAGVVATAAALAAGELTAGLERTWRSPVESVAETVIDRSPKPVTEFGIRTFGSNDKLALIIGIVILLALASPAVGLLACRRRRGAAVAFGAVGAIGVVAALQGHRAPITAAIPSVAAALVGFGALLLLLRHQPEPETTEAPDAPVGGGTRRAFLGVAAGTTVLAGLAAVGGRSLRARFSAAASRRDLVLRRADVPGEPVPAGVEVGVDGMRPFTTPNADFYRVDTALLVPQVPVEGWELRIHGLVEDELRLDFDALCDRGLVETDITMTCVSDQLNGDLIGHARWLGVPLQQLLDEVGVDARADQIVGRSIDGYTCGFPVEAAADRPALVAVGMNGEALPLEHGFPARLVTPGLYGYIGSTKWLTEIELTTFADFDQYWVPRGYADRAPIKTMTRVDVPRSGTMVTPGPAMIAGTAWAQTRGIRRVEVKLDDDAWADAELGAELNAHSWRQWRFPWNATAGAHRVAVRATDASGELQTDERRPILPDGASGWVTQLITVSTAS